MTLHMIKLCVGCDTVEELVAWRRGRGGAADPWTLHTRQTPKRGAELVEGGSLYRVFKGVILCRQAILAVDTVGEGVTARCEVTLSPQIVRVAPTPRRAFQGWRYLTAADAPADLGDHADGDIPEDLARALREAGAW
jgi:hypothetical protein